MRTYTHSILKNMAIGITDCTFNLPKSRSKTCVGGIDMVLELREYRQEAVGSPKVNSYEW
jgi:hypothetical protein